MSARPGSYISLAGAGRAQSVVDKSRFIAFAAPIDGEANALQIIEGIKREHRDASAHAYAYIDGYAGNLRRFNDGGEPSGTAGLPLLDFMAAKNLTRCLCVVTRWFGGVKLGKGGLIRAFGGCGIQAMEDAGFALYELTQRAKVSLPYDLLGKVENRLLATEYRTLSTDYAGGVTLLMAVRLRQFEAFGAQMLDWTGARARITREGESDYEPWPLPETDNG
ncbi:MAG: IMPACT family protein [Christensenellales bacterium]|jgi:uncharacterized YigZ family protein